MAFPLEVSRSYVNWHSHYEEQQWRFLKKLKTELTRDLAIQGMYVLGTYRTKFKYKKITCTPMFIVVLFTIAKAWK